jgi:hypothetical protein
MIGYIQTRKSGYNLRSKLTSYLVKIQFNRSESKLTDAGPFRNQIRDKYAF